jgi:hypothetical protein
MRCQICGERQSSRASQDSQAAVAKAALLSGTGVLRLTVVLACKQVCRQQRASLPAARRDSRAALQGTGVPPPEMVAAWTASRALFAEACGLAVGSENSGVKLQAIKFVEAAALAYSAALSVPALLSAPLASDLRDGLRVALGAPKPCLVALAWQASDQALRTRRRDHSAAGFAACRAVRRGAHRRSGQHRPAAPAACARAAAAAAPTFGARGRCGQQLAGGKRGTCAERRAGSAAAQRCAGCWPVAGERAGRAQGDGASRGG